MKSLIYEERGKAKATLMSFAKIPLTSGIRVLFHFLLDFMNGKWNQRLHSDNRHIIDILLCSFRIQIVIMFART